MSKGKKSMSNRHVELLFSAPSQFQDMKILHCSYRQIEYWNYPESYFRYWCFYWNSTPGAWITYQSQKFELSPQKIVLIPPFTPFSSGMSKPFTHFYLHFYSPGILDKIRRTPIFLEAGEIANTVSNIFNQSNVCQMLSIYGLLFNYLAKIPEKYCLLDSEENINPIIRKAVDLMHENINVPFDNRQCSRLVGLGINEFYALFKQEMHLTPRQYMLMLRLEHSSILLRHSQSSIDKIAENCGFADRYHFSKAFKTHFGIPPVEFRKKHINH